MITKGSKVAGLLVGLSLMVAIGTAFAQTGRPDAKMYSTFAEDSLVLSAWVTLSGDASAPLLILLPMMGHTHDSYTPLITALQNHSVIDSTSGGAAAKPHIVSLDLRGHGLSTSRGKENLNYKTMDVAEFRKYPNDVSQTAEQVFTRTQLEPPLIYVIGASIGANTAMMVSELLPSVSKVALLSPGEDYRGLKPAEALKKFKGRILIFACEDDKYSAASSRKLTALNEEHCTLHIFRGSDHGTDIINNNPEAMRILVDWLCAP